MQLGNVQSQTLSTYYNLHDYIIYNAANITKWGTNLNSITWLDVAVTSHVSSEAAFEVKISTQPV